MWFRCDSHLELEQFPRLLIHHRPENDNKKKSGEIGRSSAYDVEKTPLVTVVRPSLLLP